MLFHRSTGIDGMSRGYESLYWSSGPMLLPQGTGDYELDKVLENAGYCYDPIQDIFYSTLDPWQRKTGYCRLYDEVAAPMGMIIDAEPIYFEYQNKKWMIGLWKGQYDLVTGGEIGIYTGSFDLDLPGVFNGIFYHSVSDDELLPMSFTLKKNGETLLRRQGKHWWLTGFKLGEFSEPSELTMEIGITLDNEIMRDAFVSGLTRAGYSTSELTIYGNTVRFIFDVPHTAQPMTRTTATDWIIQRKNKLLCDKYQEITAPYTNFVDKIKVIEVQAPELYNLAMKIGKNKQFYDMWAATTILAMITAYCLSHGKNMMINTVLRKNTVLEQLKQSLLVNHLR